MKIGFSKTEITPALPIELSGFAAKRECEGIHDDLYVKVVLLQNNETICGFIAYDLLAVDHLLIEEIKNILKKLNLNPVNFVISATHTHSGPHGIIDSKQGVLKGVETIFGHTNETYISYVVKQSEIAINSSIKKLSDGLMKMHHTQLEGIGANRNSQTFSGNNNLFVIELIKENEKACIINYACHPTVLNMLNKQISADYVGAMSKHLEDDGVSLCLFLNGSCGDISTRFTRKGAGFDEVERYGILGSKTVLAAMKQETKAQDLTDFQAYNFSVELTVKKADSVQEASDRLKICLQNYEEAKLQELSVADLRVVESLKEGAEANLRYAYSYEGKSSYDVNISILELNDEIMVCIPGELFSELSNEIQNEEKVHFICYANGYYMYFANEYAYDHQFYEAFSSPFVKGQSEKMMSTIKNKIREIKQRRN